ncbi:MAG: Colicin production protein [Verrucomicrobiota bacterium]|jgi:uncharacterized membrane protein required for colicin V production
MKLVNLNWVDVVVLLLVVLGLWRGKTRGMSQEILDIIKWVLILVVAALFYRPGSRWLASFKVFSPLSCNVMAYLLIAFAITLVMAVVRERLGSKLVSSEVFGNGEYYLGMFGGAFRYLCIILVGMAFLNARYYSPAERLASVRQQELNYGARFFPGLADLQDNVFQKSVSGRFTRAYLPVVLIQRTPVGTNAVRERRIARQREGMVDQILEKK